MDLSHGVPESAKTICVISTILGGNEAQRLEELRLAGKCEGENLLFGLLADLPASKEQSSEEDEKLLRTARRTVRQLNQKYGGGFYLFTRERSFDGDQYSGHERKRGALLELAKLICDQDSALTVSGDLQKLSGTKYILTLDSDTKVYPGSVGELIGAAIHPLNEPVLDNKRHMVVKGYGILQPHLSTELQSATATDFALIFAGAGGSDPYGGTAGELYMDAFDNGGFAGKGLIHAAALLECTAHRLPEGRILSHDALEGAYLRGGYVGDVEFSDRFPSKPLAYYKRLHRWIRGDWQNARWIFKSELSAMDRFRLFDSLRRSLLSPMTFEAILLGFMYPATWLKIAALAALLSLLSNLILAFAQHGMERRQRVRLRQHSRLLTGIGGAIVQSFMALWLLPYEAWVSITAIVTALWRMLISHKGLLQWQTAAQSEMGDNDLARHIRLMWFPVVLGVLLMAFSPSIIGKASGFMWLLSPVAARALALPAYKEHGLSRRDREYLIKAAGENLNYLLNFSTAEDNFLPPDNFQEQPPVGIAHRTSPTNMGLAMLAAECGARMGLITLEQAAQYISRMVDTMENMPRHLGHFYNWYDTQSLKPLPPLYISTVDSGNLYAGLLCVSQAMENQGRWELKARIDSLLADMDFSPLYDSTRSLFYICYDAVEERGAGGWYDLMASEAMLTSYLTVAKGDVPIKHWRRLSRAQLQKDGYRGLASWTGTMFEYLMPSLFLPVYRNSLLYESHKFCLYAQRRRSRTGKPWGISESAFFSLDSSLSYRYKANGCAALALKRGQDKDMVVSPYSSFLALAVEPEASVRNLRCLESYEARSRYGFIEAVDFTPSRCRGHYEPVRCYMAHHVSMSIIAAANATCHGYARQLFMGDAPMAAHCLLLQERLPTDGVVIPRGRSDIPQTPQRNISQRWQLRGSVEDSVEKACLLSNGAYNIFTTNHGESSASCGKITIYEALNLSCNGQELLPTTQPEMWELGEEQCSLSLQPPDYSATVSLAVAAGELGELRTLRLVSSQRQSLTLELSFEPMLAESRHYRDHPAYWRLGLVATEQKGALLLQRLPKGDTKELWMCLKCSEPCSYQADVKGGLGSLSQPKIKAQLSLNLDGGKTRTVSFALCLAQSPQTAMEGAERILKQKAKGSMVGAAAVHLGMTGEEIGAAMEMVLPLWRNALSGAAPQAELWRYGISGDLPILCCDGNSPDCEKLVRRFCLLKSCGLNADLVIFSDEQGEYRQPVLNRVSSVLSAVGLEPLLDSYGGVHIAPSSAMETVKSRAAYISGETPRLILSPALPKLSADRDVNAVPPHRWLDHGFEFTVENSLPSRCWQHVLTNGGLSYIATDCGMGNMWLENAREMRVNLPPENILDVSGTESLYLDYQGKAVSLFAANDGYSCTVTYAPGYAIWSKQLEDRTIKTTIFIPAHTNARILSLEGAQGLKLHWSLSACLGARDGSSVIAGVDDNYLHLENPEAYLQDRELLAAFSFAGDFDTSYVPTLSYSGLCTDRAIFACGFCGTEELGELLSFEHCRSLFAATLDHWAEKLGSLSLNTANPALDHYINTWAVYQSIACRLEARASLYQSGGAIGFRDQLQDSVNLMLINPSYAREQILDSCCHQYLEGDVMHWWHRHPDGDKGVRTRCSDDLLWLVWALCEYVEATGDMDICHQSVPFVSSQPLSDAEGDRYEQPKSAERDKGDTVLHHAIAALECCIARGFGQHGLPRMLAGDWNDALNDVEGESVWLGWFFAHCAYKFSKILNFLGMNELAKRYSSGARQIGSAADNAWSGSWYIRGYFADGQALDRLDSLTQSWAAMSRFSTQNRRNLALNAALDHLIVQNHKLVKLFDPPFSTQERSPGYIVGYGQGFRENGGQYTHGAVWLAMAAIKCGKVDKGYEILNFLLPENHDLSRYAAEPFVLLADVYSAPNHEGEAGWTWYTGSAAWFFRVVTQELFGLKLRGGKLYIEPNLPKNMPNYSLSWRGRKIHCDHGHIYVDGEVYLGQGL
jgi:cyclic beta-1,2-glucan synthetase